MVAKGISKSTLKRLPIYLTYLKSLNSADTDHISSTAIANALSMGEVQVRKDLASISDSGKPKVGYLVVDLISELEAFLGYDTIKKAVIIGTGKLGKAFLDYEGFNEYGLNIIAGFDSNKELEGVTKLGKPILNISKLYEVCQKEKIKIGVITVPAQHAQSVCDMMINCGIVAILNYAPVHLVVPDNVLVRYENIASSLAILANALKGQKGQIEYTKIR